jgi:hypothetical protein
MLQLAGIAEPSGKQSLSQAIQSAYQQAGARQVMDNKLSNMTTPFSDSFGVLRHIASTLKNGPNSLAADLVRTDYFFYLIPTLGLMALGPFVFGARWAIGRAFPKSHARTSDVSSVVTRFGVDAAVLLAISYVVWAATLFGPKSTVLHQGSYLVPILASVVGVLLLWLTSPRFAVVAVAASVIYQTYLYTAATPPARVGGMIGHPTRSGVAALIVSIAVSAAVYLWIARTDYTATHSPPTSSGNQATRAPSSEGLVNSNS